MKKIIIILLFATTSTVVCSQSMEDFWRELAFTVLPKDMITKHNAVFFGAGIAQKDQIGTIVDLKRSIFGKIIRAAPFQSNVPEFVGKAIDQSPKNNLQNYSMTLKKGFALGLSLNLISIASASADTKIENDIKMQGQVDFGWETLDLKVIKAWGKANLGEKEKHYAYNTCYYVRQMSMTFHSQDSAKYLDLKAKIVSLAKTGSTVNVNADIDKSKNLTLTLIYPADSKFYPFCTCSMVTGQKVELMMASMPPTIQVK